MVSLCIIIIIMILMMNSAVDVRDFGVKMANVVKGLTNVDLCISFHLTLILLKHGMVLKSI